MSPIEVGIDQVARKERMTALVDAERDRRIAAGFAYAGKVFQFREEDKARITGMATLAGFAIGQGALAGNLLWHGGVDPFEWITLDNTTIPLDAPSMFEVGQRGAEHERAHIFAARTLKNMTTIPADFEADLYWPARP